MLPSSKRGDLAVDQLGEGGTQQHSPAIPLPPNHPVLVDYRIHVRTSDLSGAGTCANVRLSLSGELRVEEFRLDKSLNHSKMFERGREDTFEFKVPPLGILRSATVMHDESGPDPAWHLLAIEVIDTSSMQSYLFRCQQWVARDQGNTKVVASAGSDGENWISLLLKKPQNMPYRTPQDLVLYKVHVRTSDIKGAGTDANVFLSITGEFDSVRSLELEYASNNGDKFESGSDDVFEFHLPPLGNILSIKIMHDNFGDASAWHLQDVEIIDTKEGKAFLFACSQWLSKNEGTAMVEKTGDSEANILISIILETPEVKMIPILYK